MLSQTGIFGFGGLDEPFVCASGETLPGVRVAYSTYGRLNADASNAVLLFHALSGSHHAAGWLKSMPAAGTLWTDECWRGWWSEFIGPGKPLDSDRYFIICANYHWRLLRQHRPAQHRPPRPASLTARASRTSPRATSSAVTARLLDHLGIGRLHAVIGPSIGGLLALTFATRYPERVRIVVPIASGGAPPCSTA
jgi:homoserine O-acetyltransferase/O-succinyltransferase